MTFIYIDLLNRGSIKIKLDKLNVKIVNQGNIINNLELHLNMIANHVNQVLKQKAMALFNVISVHQGHMLTIMDLLLV